MSSSSLNDCIGDLKAYRDNAVDVDPLKLWAEVAQHDLPGVIFWTVDASNTVKLSVGRGFEGSVLNEREAEGSKLEDWTALAIRIVTKTRENKTYALVGKETEGPSTGSTFLTCGTLHHSGDVVLMTVDLAVIDEGHAALHALRG